MEKLTKEQCEETMKIPLKYPEVLDDKDRVTKRWLHCKSCLDDFLKSPMSQTLSPREWGQYEVSTYIFTYPNGVKASILVVWCKRCQRSVWDSRHLTALF